MDIFSDQFPELCLVRREGDAAVNIQFEGRLDFGQATLVGDLQDTPHQYQGSGWHPGDGCDVFRNSIPGELFNFILPFVQQGNAQFRRSYPMAPERGILQKNGAEVSVMNILIYLVDRMTSADDQSLAGQQV